MEEKRYFDVVVIGAGPGGYVAAIRAAQSGKTVALVEKGHFGGSCLNVGCIPTKTLIAGAEVLDRIQHASAFGIHLQEITFDFAQMKERKDRVIAKMRNSLRGLIESNKIVMIQGTAEFTAPKELKIDGAYSGYVYGKAIIVASGSEPIDFAAFPCDSKKIFNSTSILEWQSLPKTLAIIGGGYIGCEFASLYAQLGVHVIILEALPEILAFQGRALSQALTHAFTKKGIEIRTNAVVERVDTQGEGAILLLKDGTQITADAVLVSIGRKPVSKELRLDKAGVEISANGAIVVNHRMETTTPGVYAIGDVTGKVMLAHVASHQGVVAAVNATGGDAVMEYETIPSVIFTLPQIASVGLTLEEALGKGIPAAAGRYPFQALGRSVASMDTEGFVTVVVHQQTHQILGAQVIGHEASSLIAEMALAIRNELTVSCITQTIHAHPTLPEAWFEASLVAIDMPLHLPPKVKP